LCFQQDNELFTEEFFDILRYVMVYQPKVPSEKMLSFVAKLSASLYSQNAWMNQSDSVDNNIEHPFVKKLFEFVFQVSVRPLILHPFEALDNYYG